MQVVFSPVLSPNSVVQWVRGLTTNLQVMSSNSAGSFTIFIFPKIFKSNFLVKYCKIENSKAVKVFQLKFT